EASLFELLSSARTRIGEETLAAWLKAPAGHGAVRARQEAATELAPRTDLREDLAVLGEDARTGLRADALAAWGERPARLESTAVPGWVWLLSGAGLIAALCLPVWFASAIGLLELRGDVLLALRIYVLTWFVVSGAIIWRFHARTAEV